MITIMFNFSLFFKNIFKLHITLETYEKKPAARVRILEPQQKCLNQVVT